jgi:hypothetical protein
MDLTLTNCPAMERATILLLNQHQTTIKHLKLICRNQWALDPSFHEFLFIAYFNIGRTGTDFLKIRDQIQNNLRHGRLANLKRINIADDDSSSLEMTKSELRNKVYDILSVIKPQCIQFFGKLSWLYDSVQLDAIRSSGAKCFRALTPFRSIINQPHATLPNIETLCLEYYGNAEDIADYEFRLSYLSQIFPNLRNFAVQFKQYSPDMSHLTETLEELNAFSGRIKSVVCVYMRRLLSLGRDSDVVESYYSQNEILDLVLNCYPNSSVRKIYKSGDVLLIFKNSVRVIFHTEFRRDRDSYCACFGMDAFSRFYEIVFGQCSHDCFCQHF